MSSVNHRTGAPKLYSAPVYDYDDPTRFLRLVRNPKLHRRPQMSTDADSPRRMPTRRETILSLVTMLLEKDGDLPEAESSQQPSFEDDKDVPSVDEHRQTVGAEQFNRFHRRIDNLDKQLRNFANATRQLGSSVAILSSAFSLRGQIAQILFLYHENAADLFPRKVSHATKEAVDAAKIKGRRRHKPKASRTAPPHIARPTIDESLDLEMFPEQFEALADNLGTFGRCLNEFPEFNDESINASLNSFEGDLRYWANCLSVYQGQFRYPAVQRYVHDLAAEMGEHIDSITATLVMFVEVGVPTIRFGQKHKTDNLDAVNSFWFMSLVFSIAAAVNSLLGLTWKQAMYRSPGHRVPWWVLIWIKRSPLVFLVMSVACFSIGLCLFAYASGQHPVTSAITTVFTAFTSFGLAAVSAWFAMERYVFLRHSGRKWLLDVLDDVNKQILAIPGVQRTRKFWRQARRRMRAFNRGLKRVGSKTVSLLSYSSDSDEKTSDDLEANNVLPVANGHSREPSAALSAMGMRSQSEIRLDSPHPSEASGTIVGRMSAETSAPPKSPTSPAGGASSIAGPSRGKLLWKNALQTVKMRAVASAPFGPHTPHRQRTSSSTLTTGMERKRTTDEPVKAMLLRSRVATLKPKLTALVATEALEAHQALVRHLQFSPDGKFLATSSWDRTSIVWRVHKPSLSLHRVLAHPQGFVGQVAWSETGMLLTKLVRGVKVWTEDGVCQKTIDRQTNVESITWCPGGEAFLSVEDNIVTKLDLRGHVLDQYDFGRMKLHDVAVTPDGVRLLGVGPLLESPGGLHPSKSPAEKRLAVYNTETKQIEHQTPVLNDVRDVTLARNIRNGLVALVSYENKAPPQLWKMELLKDRENPNILVARLTLRHTYMPKHAVEFAGPSYFGGKNDELVLCAGKAGDIHIWDQESGTLLRHIRAQAQQSGDLTCIAWNHAADDPFMFATGSHDGAVRIWTKPEVPPEIPPEQAGERAAAGVAVEPRRSASPFEMDRTDSPLTQAEFEALDRLRESTAGSEVSIGTTQRERMVAFAENSDEA
ncbi:Catabolite degradation [Mycena kentingensis (nom. inval.)]|nr:Catabolite degradation [Mycena kentingensis (nom. inval.)]